MSLKKKQIVALCICVLLLGVAIFQNLRKDTTETANQVDTNENNNSSILVAEQLGAADEFFAGSRVSRESSRSSLEDSYKVVIADVNANTDAKTIATEKAQAISIMNECEKKMEVAIKSRGYDDVFVIMDAEGNIDTTLKSDQVDQNEVMTIAGIIMDNIPTTMDKIVVKCIK